MCGILYLKRNDGYSPLRPLLSRYHAQKTRGQQGFGFCAVKNGKLIGYERATTFEEIEKKLNQFHSADEILMHHRLPTSTKNLEETAHPILVSNKILKSDYYFIHNGVINNENELKLKHEELGFEYSTEVEIFGGYKKKHGKKKHNKIEVIKTEFNDSESLAIEFALFNEGIKQEIETRGSAAFICYEVDKKTSEIKALHYGRNDNPMKLFKAHGMMVLSSASTDKGNVDIEAYKCWTINYKNKEFLVRPMRLDTTYKSHSSYSSSASPDYNSHTSHSIGFNVTEHISDKLPFTTADADDKKTVISLAPPRSDPMFEELEKICSHGNKKITCTKCPVPAVLCEHGHADTERCAECYESKLIKSCVIELCDRTSKPIQECYCKLHRKHRGSIKSPYQVADNVEERLLQRSVELEDEIASLECLIDDLEYDIKHIEEQGTNGEAWFDKCTELDKAKRQLSDAERNLNRLAEFSSGVIF